MTNTVDPDGDDRQHQSVRNLAVTGPVNLAQDFGYRDTSNPNTIAGTLWEDPNADGTLDAGEAGSLRRRDGGAARTANGNIVATTTTDASGNYSFTNLPDGTYTVDVTDDANVLNGYWHSTRPNPGADNNSQVDPYTVTVTGGQTNDHRRLRLLHRAGRPGQLRLAGYRTRTASRMRASRASTASR